MGPGWNLVTYGGNGGVPDVAFATLSGNYIAIYAWDGTKWLRYFAPNVGPSFLNTMGYMWPGQALWILTTAPIP